MSDATECGTLPTANDLVASGHFDDPVRYFRRVQDLLDQAAKDPALVAAYQRQRSTCPTCRGVLTFVGDDGMTCPTCHGCGYLLVEAAS